MNNLKKLREERHITQTELARKTGIPVSTIRAYESGKRKIESTNVIRILSIAKVLNCYFEDLINEV